MLPTLEQAIQAIKAGDKVKGRQLLADIIQADYNNELAWLWMSSVADSDEQRRKYLEQVLKINPANKAAQKGLAVLNQKLAEQKKQAEAPAVEIDDSPGSRSLGARLAARTKSKQPEPATPAAIQMPPAEPRPESRLQPDEPPKGSTPATVETSYLPESRLQPDEPPKGSTPATTEPSHLPESRLQPDEPLEGSTLVATETSQLLESRLQPEKLVEEAAPAEGRISEIREQFAESSKLPPALRGLERLWQTERGKWLIGGGLVSLLFVCLGCAVCGLILRLPGQEAPSLAAPFETATATPIPPPPTNTPAAPPSPTPALNSLPTATNTPVVLPTSTVTPTPTRTPTPNRNLQTAQVVGVIDGDMIDIILGNQIYRVKYILINAPALDDPELGTESFGPEALELNRRLVEGQTVTLEKDVSDADAEGRLLRYVYIGDLMVNEELLRQGLARVELLPPDLKYGARLQAVEQAAQAANLGIWSIE